MQGRVAHAPGLQHGGQGHVLQGRATLFVVALLTSNAGSLAFHVLSSRLLGPESYGALGSLLVLVAGLTVPFTAMQVALTGEVARRREAGRPIAAGALALRLTLIGMGGAAALVALAPLLQAYLHLPSPTPILWLAGYRVSMSASVVPWACLCGRRWFAGLASAVLIAVAVRIGLGALLLTSGAGVAGAAAATLGGEVVLASGLLFGARGSLHGGAVDRLWMGLREAVGGIGALAGFSALVALDSLLARHYLAPADAGRYAAAAVLARGALFLCQAATSAAVPGLADLPRDVANAVR